MSDYEYEVWCDGEFVASACGPKEDAQREAMHYASQYAQDGNVEVFCVKRTRKLVVTMLRGTP